jgi:hypothetical protein
MQTGQLAPMSQQPSQWSPEAVQIFSAARQLASADAQNAYIAQVCGANAHLRWEVDWLMQWDRNQAAAAAYSPAMPPNTYAPGAPQTKVNKRLGWGWIATISAIVILFVGFLGVFIYGAVRGVRHVQLTAQSESVERTAHDQFQDGEFVAAARGYERAVDIRKQQYGENHSKVSEMLANAASAWYYDGDFEKAAAQYEKAYKLDLARVGPKDKETLNHQRYWAICLLEARHAVKSHEVFSAVLSMRKDAQGASNEDTSRAHLDLARCLETMGRTPEALAEYELGYEGLKKKFTAQYKDSMQAMNSIVRCYDSMGRFDDSRKLLSSVYESQKTSRGFDDPQTESLRTALCERLEKDQAWDALAAIRQEAFDERVARLSADNPLSVDSKELLADARVLQGQFDVAITLLKECVEKRASLNGKESDAYWQCMHALADAYNKAKSPGDGIARFQADADELREKYGPRSPATIQAAARVGWRKIRAGEQPAGELDLEKALAGGIEALGLKHEATRDIAIDLAEHYHKTRQFAKEVELRRRIAQEQLHAAGIEDETTRQRLESQADAELDAGNVDAALDLYKRLHDFETNRSGAGGIITFFQARSLALAYLRSNQAPKAVECIEEVMTKLKRSGRREYWSSRTAADFGMLLARLGNPQKSCEAYELATQQREFGVYESEYQIERLFSYWAKQAAAAKATDSASAALKKQLDEVKREVGSEHYLAHAISVCLGLQAEAAGDFAAAEAIYRELAKAAKDKSIGWLAEANYRLGGVLLAQQKIMPAEEATRQAIALFEKIEQRAVDLRPEQELTTLLDAELQLARCLAAQDNSAGLEELLLKIETAKAKLNYEEEGLWDVRCRAGALSLLIDLESKRGNSAAVEKWKAELGKIESVYPGASKI